MRISTKTFGQRTPFFPEKQNPKSKYILVYEGEETEVQYFDGVAKYKEEIGINPIIEIKPLLRSYKHKSYSNPIRIIEILNKYLNEGLNNGITVEGFIDCVIDYLTSELGICENSIYSPKMIESDLKKYFIKTIGLHEDSVITDIKDIIKQIVDHLKQEIDLYDNVDKILSYIEQQQIVYDKNLDKICLIIDRDPQNFKEFQYDDVVKKCNSLEYKLYISNPCFEFWLLLHSKEVNNIDRDKLIKNERSKPRSKKRFIETELSRIFEGYKKTNIKFERFKDNITLAIDQEKSFCEDIPKLKNNLGSNVGLLLEEMLNKK